MIDLLNKLKETIGTYRATYTNWFLTLLKLALTDRARATIRGGNIVEGNAALLGRFARLHSRWVECCRAVDASSDLSYIVIKIKEKKIKLYGWYKVPFQDLDIYSSILDVNSKSVLDVGTYVGDSAILFALMGAKRVVAVEPSPWAYNVAKRNVEVNNLEDLITLVNCAVSKENGKTLMLPSGEIDPGSFEATSNVQGDVPVLTCTLDSLIEKYGPFDVMKMDCEGCEHESIPYSRRIGEVKEVLVEYHGGYEDVEKKLRKEGFVTIKYCEFADFLRKRLQGLYESPLNPRLGCIYASK